MPKFILDDFETGLQHTKEAIGVFELMASHLPWSNPKLQISQKENGSCFEIIDLDTEFRYKAYQLPQSKVA